MTKGTTASRAVLAVIGGMMAVAAIGAGLQPLMGIIGFADQSSDVGLLQDLDTAVREKCAEADNGEAHYRTEFTAEFSSLKYLTVKEGKDQLIAKFVDSQDEWDSRVYECSLSLDAGDRENVTNGEWTFNITGSNSDKNPEVTIEAEQ